MRSNGGPPRGRQPTRLASSAAQMSSQAKYSKDKHRLDA